MKSLTSLIIILFLSFSAKAQDVTGKWNGLLKIQGMQLRVVFHVEKTKDGYISTMDSPDQGAAGIPVTKTTYDSPNVTFEIASARIEYSGEVIGREIIGVFKQGGQEFPMNLSRKSIEKEAINRPQEPIAPFDYYTEEVVFKNKKAKVSLAGTLTLPRGKGRYPVVVLISGSGPQNRNEELMSHKPFLVLADHLTKNGIGVLRFDDRGVGASTGNFATATTADFATDVESAVKYLKKRKDINKSKIGLVGHSEGGIIAPMVAIESKKVSYIVLLAGTGIRGDELLLMQQELIAKANGVSDEEIKNAKAGNTRLFELVIDSKDSQKLKMELTTYMNEQLESNKQMQIPNGMTKEAFVDAQVNAIANPWMEYFIKFDPTETLEQVKCPVLAINGEMDLQVPAKENLTAIKKALSDGGNTNVTTTVLPNLNHLFQECTTGSPSEYSEIEQTFSPIALDEISKWILEQVK